MNKLENMWAVILKTSTGSWLCLVSKANDKNKIKTYDQTAYSDISLKCIYFVLANQERHIIITLVAMG